MTQTSSKDVLTDFAPSDKLWLRRWLSCSILLKSRQASLQRTWPTNVNTPNSFEKFVVGSFQN